MIKRIVPVVLIFSLFCHLIFSQSKPEVSYPKNYSIVEKSDGTKTFVQRLQWEEYEDIRFYKVEIEERKSDGTFGNILEQDTEQNFIELSLPSGSYRYRVSLYNVLGNFENQSDWLYFNILKALQPRLSSVTRDESDNLVFTGENLLPASKFEMTYSDANGKKVVAEGKISKSGNGNKTQSVRFNTKDLPAGKYKFSVSNPGGLKDEREFEIKEKPVVVAQAPESTTQADKNTTAKPSSGKKQTTASNTKEKNDKSSGSKTKADSKSKSKATSSKSSSKTKPSKSKTTTKSSGTKSKTGSKTNADAKPAEKDIASSEAKPERKGIAAAIDNIQASIGYTLPIQLMKSNWEDYVGSDLRFLNFGLRVSTVPFKTGIGNFGFGVNATYSRVKFEKSYNVKSFTLTGNIFDIMIEGIWHKPLSSKFTLDVHAGAGISLFHNFIYDYSSGYSTEKVDSINPIIGIGAAAQFKPVKHFYIEAGADAVFTIDKKIPGCEITPRVSVGWKF